MCTKHTRQELTCVLSILRIRNLCLHRAYTPGNDAVEEHMHQVLMRVLSICITNLCGCRAYRSIPCTYHQHKHKNSELKKGYVLLPHLGSCAQQDCWVFEVVFEQQPGICMINYLEGCSPLGCYPGASGIK